MALKIGLSSYVSGGFTNPVIWRLYEDVSGVLIDEHQEMGPHGVIYNFVFSDNIIDIAYRIEFYDQPGGVGIGNLIKSHVVTPSTQTLVVDSDIELIVDGAETYDPVSTADNFTVPATIGKDIRLEQRGVGTLFQTRGIEIVHDKVTGKITFSDGSFPNTDDRFIIIIKPQYVVNPPGSQAPSTLYKDIIILDADITLTSADFGKLYIVKGIANVITITLPATATIVKKVSLFVRSQGPHKSVIIKAAVGETIDATGTTSQTFILGQAEEAEVIRVNDQLYGFTDSQDIKRAGQLDWAYTVGLNRAWADGTEVLCADYPRVKKAMDNLEVGQVVTYATWGTSVVIDGVTVYPNKGFFALSNDGLSFKFPDFRNLSIRALRYSDNTVDDERLTQKGGGYQYYKVGKHRHWTINNHSDTGGTGVSAINYICFQGERGGAGDFKYTLNGHTDQPTLGLTSDGAGTDHRENNIGMVPQIIV